YHKFELNPETLYLTIYIVDRYLAVETASRRELQLVGISAMLIASKYEETWAPEVKRISEVAQGSKILATHTDSPGEFRLCSMRLMKLPKMLNQTWSIMPELRSSLPHSRQGNTTNKNKQKLHVVLPSPASTSQVHNGDTLKMEGTTSQTVDSNEMENMRATLEAMTRALERLSTEVGAIRGEVTTISGRLEQVESQRNSRPSTP
ncbi:hypothetical protein T459_03883, partial [Capsicum annuum]